MEFSDYMKTLSSVIELKVREMLTGSKSHVSLEFRKENREKKKRPV